jgi:peptidoglycan/xylan/chitin deacetylase (PgdA/CDA1 family)
MKFKLQVQLPGFFTKWFPAAVWRMPADEKAVYLTFDDGPVPTVTPWVLDLLNELQIKATFFAVGENVFRYPEIFEQILEDGHAVGNHTYHHLQGLKTSNLEYFKDIEQANRVIGSNLFRPPHGWLTRGQYIFLSQKYRIIMWDVISCDYNGNITKEEVLENVLKFVRSGSIITFHDSFKAEEHLRWALPRAIEALKAEGYAFKKIEFAKVRRLFVHTYLQRIKKLRSNFRQLSKWA